MILALLLSQIVNPAVVVGDQCRSGPAENGRYLVEVCAPPGAAIPFGISLKVFEHVEDRGASAVYAPPGDTCQKQLDEQSTTWGIVGLLVLALGAYVGFALGITAYRRQHHGDVPAFKFWSPRKTLWAKRIALCLMPIAAAPIAAAAIVELAKFANAIAFTTPITDGNLSQLVGVSSAAGVIAFVIGCFVATVSWPKK